ncbi:hypothetical protein PC123_g7281 [Phytophthora cactorum]|nr:hypothetical protein PC123_g7281 [Phytophthora cactorum]
MPGACGRSDSASTAFYGGGATVFREKLGAERKRIGRRNKNALHVTILWTKLETGSYYTVKELIKSSVPLAFSSPSSELCVMAGASLSGWSIIITEVETWYSSLPIHNQHHRMVLCKGRTFKDAQRNRAVVGKEAFSIVKACTDLEYLLQRERGFKLFCDHANPIYIFAPHVELNKHVCDRLQRWAVRLSGLRFTIEPVGGEMNVWADIIPRWKVTEVRAAAVRTRGQAATSVLRPLSDECFKFPELDGIVKTQ